MSARAIPSPVASPVVLPPALRNRMAREIGHPQAPHKSHKRRARISGLLTMIDVSCEQESLRQGCTLLATYKCTLPLALCFLTNIRREYGYSAASRWGAD